MEASLAKRLASLPRRMRWLLASLPLLGALLWWRLGTESPPSELIQRAPGYIGAAQCRDCHDEQFTSWSQTFHSTMTQLPSEATVLGRFDGREVTLYGLPYTPFVSDGQYYLRLPAQHPGGEREAEVALLVGSRRYQQYFEKQESERGTVYRRLPLLWHRDEQRFLHLSGAFLEPDSELPRPHDAIWNANCVFCHNTGIQPGLDNGGAPRSGEPVEFDSHVSNLGIACEACHGPGEAHARAHSVFASVRSLLGENPSDPIVNPETASQVQTSSLCGQCHSQRLPNPQERIWDYLDHGPSFRPGDSLEEHVTPVTRATPSLDPNNADLFADRFWADGTARLTAYEYLGLTQSPCFAGGEFSCTSCHTMHSGDPRGQLEPAMRGNAACTSCHTSLAKDVSAHTRHAEESSGSECMNCHMPGIVYGVLSIHRSHRVEKPDVARDVSGSRPNACAQCHVNRSAEWVAARMSDWWGSPANLAPRSNGVPLDAPWALIAAHSGDAAERAVTLDALGRDTLALDDRGRLVALGNALVGLGDNYGAVRLIARRSALRLDARLSLGLRDSLLAFDVQGAPDERRADLLAVVDLFSSRARARFPSPEPGLLLGPDWTLDRGLLGRLLSLQSKTAIAIGE